MATANLPEEELHELEESLKRCPAGTLEAAVAYRASGDNSGVPTIILGIIERFIEPDFRPKLSQENVDGLRLMEDLGVDSLTMMEIVILVEEVVGINFENEELKDLRTIGDVKTYMSCKISGDPIPEKNLYFSSQDVIAVMPQQYPFLFLQEASIGEGKATGSYKISGEESFLAGHFVNRPVFPASIMSEALGQLAVFYLLKSEDEQLPANSDPEKIFFTSSDGLRCHKLCVPGDKLDMSIQVRRIREPLATFTGTITVNGEKVLFIEEFTLTFGEQSS